MKLRSTPTPAQTGRRRLVKTAPVNVRQSKRAPVQERSEPRKTAAAPKPKPTMPHPRRRLRGAPDSPPTPPDSPPADARRSRRPETPDSRLRNKENGMVSLPRSHYNRHPAHRMVAGQRRRTERRSPQPVPPPLDGFTLERLSEGVDADSLPSPLWEVERSPPPPDADPSYESIAAELEALMGDVRPDDGGRRLKRVTFRRLTGDGRTCDRLVAFRPDGEFTVSIDDKRVELLGAPERVSDPDDLKILLQIVDETQLTSFNVRYAHRDE